MKKAMLVLAIVLMMCLCVSCITDYEYTYYPVEFVWEGTDGYKFPEGYSLADFGLTTPTTQTIRSVTGATAQNPWSVLSGSDYIPVENGTFLECKEDSSRDRRIAFLGWFPEVTDPFVYTESEPFNFAKREINRPIKLYAKWSTEDTAQVIYAMDNSWWLTTETNQYQAKVSGTDLNMYTSTNLTKNGYTQVGWKSGFGFNTTEFIYDEDYASDTNKEVRIVIKDSDINAWFKSIVLTPIWVKNEYTVTYNNATTDTNTVIATYKQFLPLNGQEFKKTGYHFEGLFDDDTTDSNCYFRTGWGYSYWNKTTDTTLYAIWTPKTYKATFVTSLPTVAPWEKTITEETETYDAETVVPTVTMTDCNFVGWTTDSNANRYSVLVTLTDTTWTNLSDMTYYAVWEGAKTTTITLNANYTSGTNGVATIFNEDRELRTFTSVTDRNGYVLVGYSTIANDVSGTNMVLDAKGKVCKKVDTWTSDYNGRWIYEGPTATLYAQWKCVSVKGVFNVSATKQVQFSTGILYKDEEGYKFADEQYVTVTNSTFTYCDAPYANTDEIFTNADTFKVVGQDAGDWKTLTSDEWQYFLSSTNTRSALKTVGGVEGYVFYPSNVTKGKFEVQSENLTIDEFKDGESEYGWVFIPTEVYDIWTASPDTQNNNNAYVINNSASVKKDTMNYVRLVKVVTNN